MFDFCGIVTCIVPRSLVEGRQRCSSLSPPLFEFLIPALAPLLQRHRILRCLRDDLILLPQLAPDVVTLAYQVVRFGVLFDVHAL